MIHIPQQLVLSGIAGMATAVAAGFLGVFMVMRRIALVSDALSHVALPGIALGILFNLNPFIGGFTFLLMGVFLIGWLEERTDLPTDAIVGVIFSASLALGIVLTPAPELLEALFGDFTRISALEALAAVLFSIAVVAIGISLARRLMFIVIGPDLAHASKSHSRMANLIFFIMLAAIVALGIKFVGTLLMGTLTIIPAAAAKNVARSLVAFGVFSMAFAALSVALGIAASFFWGVLAGPAIILASVMIFLFTLLVPARK